MHCFQSGAILLRTPLYKGGKYSVIYKGSPEDSFATIKITMVAIRFLDFGIGIGDMLRDCCKQTLFTHDAHGATKPCDDRRLGSNGIATFSIVRFCGL